MPLDGAVAEVELGGDVEIGLPPGRQSGDLRLLRREGVPRISGPPAYGFAGGQQFAAGTLGETLRAHRVESSKCGPQLGASVDAPVLASQPLAVTQLRPAVQDDDPRPTEVVDRFVVEPLCFVGLTQQRVGSRLNAPCPLLRNYSAGAAHFGGTFRATFSA